MNFYKQILRVTDPTKMNYQQKLAAAKDPNTAPEILKLLATDGCSNVRWWVARNPNTSPETLKLLAIDEDYGVRYWVARNPNTPLEILQLMATDEDRYVRYCVTQNPNRTELIERLVLMTNYKQNQ